MRRAMRGDGPDNTGGPVEKPAPLPDLADQSPVAGCESAPVGRPMVWVTKEGAPRSGDGERYPALAAWQRRWRMDPASRTRLDLLWRLACWEAQARALDELGFHPAAEETLTKARMIAAEAVEARQREATEAEEVPR